MEILEVLNAHLGTHFSMNNNWEVSHLRSFSIFFFSSLNVLFFSNNQSDEFIFFGKDVFKEEAALPEDGNASLLPDDEWPSDDSEDDDYNPERIENSNSIGGAGTDDNMSEDEISSNSSVGSDESTDAEILHGRRQRRDVDYRKLYDVST